MELSNVKMEIPEQELLYQQWKGEVIDKILNPSRQAGKRFLNSRLCQGGRPLTLTPAQMDNVMDSWQAKALKEGFIVENPNYKNGRAKYLTI